MAEKGEVPITCDQDLVCPLCLDIFEDATLLTCQHSFCRRCLKKYDDSQAADQDHMLCPLCRKVTKLTDMRIAGLSSHVAINGLVDDYISSVGGVMAILHVKPKCTSCDGHEVAVSFCSDCDMYLCEDCHRGHKKMRFFAKHRTTLMSEMEKGESNAYQQYNRCAVHELEKKDLFCVNCGVHVCLKCVVVNHRDHQIKNKEDFEKEVRLKTTDLGLRCSQEKDRVEKNIRRIEKDRQDMHLAMKNLESNVKKECDRRVQQLKKNEEMLLAEVKLIQKGFDGEFDKSKADERHIIKTILSLLNLVTVDRLASLEGESLSAHTRGCDELENRLKALSDEESTKCVRQMVESLQFCPADVMSLSVGHVMRTLTLVREVELPSTVCIMAALSQDAVVVGYGGEKAGTDCVYVSGAIEQHMKDEVGSVYGLTFLTDGRPVLSHDGKSCNVYNTPEAHDAAMKYTCTEDEVEMRMCCDHQGNIYAVNAETPEIYIFSGSNPKPERVIPCADSFIPEQICVAKTGVIICTCTCSSSLDKSMVTLSEVRVYDREGHVGSSITTNNFDVSDDDEEDEDGNGDEDEDGNGDEDEDGNGDEDEDGNDEDEDGSDDDENDNDDGGDDGYLYAAVDGQDHVLIAWVEDGSALLKLVRYTLQGNRLVKQTVFKQLELPYPVCVDGWCYLVSLTPNLIAFASDCNLYFIKV